MKCRDYREAIAADPSGLSDDAPVHAADCIACRRFRDEIRALDKRIAAALAIDVPPLRIPELPPIDSAPSANVVHLHRAGKATLPIWIGLTASLIVAAFLGTRFIASDLGRPSLASQVVAHMDHEQGSRQVTSVAVSEQGLGNVLHSDVSAMDTGGALITYARSCLINENRVPHLVIQGEDGPVTLILMSEETIDAAIPLSGENVYGVIVPVGGGSVAIIGEQASQLNEIDAIGQRLSVSWRS